MMKKINRLVDHITNYIVKIIRNEEQKNIDEVKKELQVIKEEVKKT